MESGRGVYTLKVLYTAAQCLSAPSVGLKVKNYVPLATITTNGASTFCQIKPAPTTSTPFFVKKDILTHQAQ